MSYQRTVIKRLVTNLASLLYHSPSNYIEIKYQLGVAAIKAQRNNYESFSDIRQAELRVFSQNGEDGILDFIFEKCGLIKPTFLEIGVGDFSECNSKFSNFLRGSGVYVVDSDPNLPQIYNKYRSRRVNSRLFFENIWIDSSNALDVFARANSELGNIDVLSIDIDGNDFWILKQLPLETFQVIVVEYNPSLSDTDPVTVEYDSNFDRRNKHFSWKYYGATLEAFDHYLKLHGFCFIGATSQGTNAFFVRKEYVNNFAKCTKDISEYKNLDSREARNESGSLSFVKIEIERSYMSDLPLIDVRNIK